VLRAAWWTLVALVRTRRQLASGHPRPSIAAPPDLPATAGVGVEGVITRLHASCLEGALVRQRWLGATGPAPDVVVGVPLTGFGATPAHAWLDGTDPDAARRHVELHRIAPLPPARRGAAGAVGADW
jgi:hypothetical protein